MHIKKIYTLGLLSFVALVSASILTIQGLKTPEIESIEIKEYPITDTTDNVFSMNVGVATVLNCKMDEEAIEECKQDYIKKIESEKETQEKSAKAQKIRCTGYCDYGYTKSGEYVRDGIVAGKEEWLGKTAKIYAVKADGSKGNLIGKYEFLDTGYGINGSLINGTSIDIWHPSEDAVWDWMATYGDYVYMEFL